MLLARFSITLIILDPTRAILDDSCTIEVALARVSEAAVLCECVDHPPLIPPKVLGSKEDLRSLGNGWSI